jgi:hypothetical protein
MPKAKKIAPQALFLALPRCSRRQNHALSALNITRGRKTEAPCEFCTGGISANLAAKRQKQISDRFPLAKIAFMSARK